MVETLLIEEVPLTGSAAESSVVVSLATLPPDKSDPPLGLEMIVAAKTECD
jgi:hypothetical protein